MNPRGWRPYAVLAVVALLYVFATVLATYPLAFSAAGHVRGHGDPTLNVWAMAWVQHQLTTDPLSLFDGNVFYPYPRTLAFSEHLFVPSLLAAPFSAATGNPVLGYNVVLLLSLLLAALGMFVLGREVTGDAVAGFYGGLFYAFHTWNINELLRIQIVSNQWFPFLLFALVRYFKTRRLAWAVSAAVFYGLQSLSCMYWALYLPLVVFPAIVFLTWRADGGWRATRPLLVGLAAAIALTAVFAVPYLENDRAFSYRRAAPAAFPVDHYLDVLPSNWLYGERWGTDRVNEGAAHFLGFVAIALAALGLVSRGHRSVRLFAAFLVAAGFLLSLGPHIQVGSTVLGPGPYRLLYEWVPGFQSVRYPERFSLVLVLGLSLLAVLGLSRLRASRVPWLAHVLGLALVAEHLSAPLALQPVPTRDAVPEVYRWLRAQDDVRVVAEVPTDRFWHWRSDADTMYFSTFHWKRTVQGFTGFLPPIFHFVRWRLFHFPDEASLTFLEKLGVDTVVVRPDAGVTLDDFAEDARITVDGPFAGGDFVVRLKAAHDIQYAAPEEGPELRELDPQTWRVHGSSPGAGLARDRDPMTAWTSSEEMQQEHHFYAVRFPELTRPSRISMEIGDVQPFPTEFEVLGLGEDGAWVGLPFDRERALNGYFAQLLHGRKSASIDFDLEDAPLVREIRVRITRTDPFEMPWTMSEIRVYVSRTPAGN